MFTFVPRIITGFFFAVVAFAPVHSVSAQAANLVSNGGFETESAFSTSTPENWIRGRWGTNTAVFSYPVSGPDASRAARVSITSYASGDAKWAFTPVSVTAGRTYEYRDSYTADVPTYVTVEIRLSSGTLIYNDIGFPAPSATWKSQSFRFTAPANAQSVTVFHLINQTGTLTVDDVSLHDMTPPPPSPENLILNPSFEEVGNGLPINWGRGRWGVHDASYIFPIAARTGANAARVSITSYTSGDAKWHFAHVPVSAGATYEFSDYYKSTVGTRVVIQWKRADGSFSYLDIGAPGASSPWSLFSKSFVVPVGVVSLSVFHVLKSTGTLDLDDVSLRKVAASDPTKFDQGYVSFNFDDGWLSMYENAIPILDQAGFKSTQFIISERLGGNFPGYVKPDQVRQMQASGHEIGGHTRTHPDLTTLSPADARDEIVRGRQDLLNIGAMPVNVFAYPFGGYNAEIQQMVRDAGFITGRSSDGGSNAKNADRYVLRRQPMTNSTTFAQVKGYIDAARAERQWVILLFHEVNESGNFFAVTPAFLQQVIDYLKSQGIVPITMKQGIDRMNQ